MSTLADLSPVDLSDSRSFVTGVPHAWLAHLRRNDPVHWQDEPGGPGFWAVTSTPTASRSTATTSDSARELRGRCPSRWPRRRSPSRA